MNELKKKEADTYYNQGLICAASGEFRKALENYSKAVETNPEDVAAYYARGITYNSLGEPRKAIEELNYAAVLSIIRKEKILALKCVGAMKTIEPSSPLIKKLMDKINEEPEKKK